MNPQTIEAIWGWSLPIVETLLFVTVALPMLGLAVVSALLVISRARKRHASFRSAALVGSISGGAGASPGWGC